MGYLVQSFTAHCHASEVLRLVILLSPDDPGEKKNCRSSLSHRKSTPGDGSCFANSEEAGPSQTQWFFLEGRPGSAEWPWEFFVVCSEAKSVQIYCSWAWQAKKWTPLSWHTVSAIEIGTVMRHGPWQLPWKSRSACGGQPMEHQLFMQSLQ